MSSRSISVAFAVFLVVKQMNRFNKPAPAAPATTKECPYCGNTIPLKAVRCGFCTSDLSLAKDAARP